VTIHLPIFLAYSRKCVFMYYSHSFFLSRKLYVVIFIVSRIIVSSYHAYSIKHLIHFSIFICRQALLFKTLKYIIFREVNFSLRFQINLLFFLFFDVSVLQSKLYLWMKTMLSSFAFPRLFLVMKSLLQHIFIFLRIIFKLIYTLSTLRFTIRELKYK